MIEFSVKLGSIRLVALPWTSCLMTRKMVAYYDHAYSVHILFQYL